MSAPRFVFFGGKGGVGKTTCAAAWAVGQAEADRRVLVVSTDPAHSLGDALALRLSARARPVVVRRGSLSAVELDADAALAGWLRINRPRLRAIALRGTYLDDEDMDELMRLSLPGVDELMGLLALWRLARSGHWETVVVDTAPTGHTLRLLETPATLRDLARVFDDMQEKHRVIAQSLAGRYAPDEEDAFIQHLDAQGAELTELLRDPRATTFHWVTLAEELAVAETRAALLALEAKGLAVSELIVNRVISPSRGRCGWCASRRMQQRAALRQLDPLAVSRTMRRIDAAEEPPRGIAALRALARALMAPVRRHPGRLGGARHAPGLRSALGLLVPRPAEERARARTGPSPAEGLCPRAVRLLLFGGKGGVGKTTCACATALQIAVRRPNRRILLLSTDPAPSLRDVLLRPTVPGERESRPGARARIASNALPRRVPGAPKNLFVQELDAAFELLQRRAAYRQAISELFDALAGGSHLEATYDRRIMEDLIDLAPPGMDELFALLTLVEALIPAWSADDERAPRVKSRGTAPYDMVIVDTAPTGHALRLLELPAKAHSWVRALMSVLLKYRQLVRPGRLAKELLQMSRSLQALRALLTDSSRARFIIVTRAEELPRLETERLARSLARLDVAQGALVLNALTPGPDLAPGVKLCERCRISARRERREVERLIQDSASLRERDAAVIFAPAVAPPPTGPRALLSWSHAWARR